MKASTAIVLGGLLWTGCVADDSSTTDADSNELDAVIARHGDDRGRLPNHVPVVDASGVFTTVSWRGAIDLNNEFFQDLGATAGAA